MHCLSRGEASWTCCAAKQSMATRNCGSSVRNNRSCGIHALQRDPRFADELPVTMHNNIFSSGLPEPRTNQEGFCNKTTPPAARWLNSAWPGRTCSPHSSRGPFSVGDVAFSPIILLCCGLWAAVAHCRKIVCCVAPFIGNTGFSGARDKVSSLCRSPSGSVTPVFLWSKTLILETADFLDCLHGCQLLQNFSVRSADCFLSLNIELFRVRSDDFRSPAISLRKAASSATP